MQTPEPVSETKAARSAKGRTGVCTSLRESEVTSATVNSIGRRGDAARMWVS